MAPLVLLYADKIVFCVGGMSQSPRTNPNGHNVEHPSIREKAFGQGP